MPRVESLLGDVAEAGVGSRLSKQWQSPSQAAGGIDRPSNAVIGGSQDPAAVLGGAHAHDHEMLLARSAFAEPAVVGNIEQRFRAIGGELPYEIGEHGFVTDEHADFVIAHRRNHHLFAGGKIARFRRNLVYQSRKWPRYKFA